MDELLFCKNDLRLGLEATARKLRDDLLAWSPDELLALPEADVADHLVAAHSVACPSLRRDEAQILPISEQTQTLEDPFGDRMTRRMTRLTLVIPYDGEKVVFSTRASQFSFNPPRANVADGELRLTWLGQEADAAAVRAHFDRELDDGIGFPVQRRSDASNYTVPVQRRRIASASPPRPTAGGPFQPEPMLADPDYEAALRVLRNARNALERSPSMTAKLNEEQIRDLLLVSLNAQFQGKAGGEVFNGAGRTDILIREGDRNVFIGECKIWRGPKTIRDALDQLLSYLVWRDTKATLLLFIRSGHPSEAIKKSVAEIEASPTYTRRGRHESDERVDFVLHAQGDPAREIQLAFLPFALGAGKS